MVFNHKKVFFPKISDYSELLEIFPKIFEASDHYIGLTLVEVDEKL